MTTDKKRRKMAKNLRDQAKAWRLMMPDIRMSDRRLTDSIHMAFGIDDIDATVYETLGTLADLIDRPTCRLELTAVETHGNTKVKIYECSECGRSCEEIYGKYERCPHCGAEVEDGAQD